MNRYSQKFVSLLLALAFIFSTLPYPTAYAAEIGGVQAKMNQILSDYPSGSFFTVNGKACSHGSKAVKCPVCGLGGNNSCANCSLISICRAKDVSVPSGQGCAHTCVAFVSYVMNQVFGLKLSGNTTQISMKSPVNKAASYQNAKVGDIIYFYKANGAFAHVAICMGVSDKAITLYECNASNKPSEVLCRTISYAQMKTYHPSFAYCAVYRANNYDEINGTVIVDPPTAYVTITFDPNGGSVFPTTQVIEKGSDPRNLPTAVREGYTFCGWTLDRTNDNFNGSTAAVTESSGYGFEEDTTIYALWVTRTPTTTFYVILDDGSTCRRITVTNGSAYGSLPTPTKEGYTFDGWYTQKEGGSEITTSTKVNLTSDQTLYAHWTQMAHEHIKSNPMISPEHPHYTFYTCTCGKVFTDYKTNYDDSCTACVLSELGGNLIDEPNPVSPQPKPERPQKEPTNPQYHWGPWSEWSTDPVSRSDTREVQTRTVTEQIKISSGSTEYRYGGYATSDGRHECWCETYLRNKFGSANLRYSDWSTTRYSVNGSNWTCGNCNGSHTHVDHYGSDGRAWWPEYTLPNGQNYYWEEIRTTDDQYSTIEITQYRYRDKIYD